jgi:hypothetical protein
MSQDRAGFSELTRMEGRRDSALDVERSNGSFDVRMRCFRLFSHKRSKAMHSTAADCEHAIQHSSQELLVTHSTELLPS